MVELQGNELVFKSPKVHRAATCRLGFQRTLRIPDDNRDYPLPAGLGRFPMAHMRDHAARVPDDWHEHGGVLLPMYQAEAMWIEFDYPLPFRGGYAPDLNPVEYLWAWLKRHALANYCPNDLAELHATARNKLKSAQKRPSIIAACWMQATLW